MATRLVLGIDEAGRGPALGPLVLAAVALDAAGARRLTRAGVVDSKRFGSGAEAHAARAALVEVVQATAAWIGLETCDVETVDAYVETGDLNVLERERAQRLIGRAPACARMIADGRRLFGPLRARHPALEARDRAESVHVAVAAASLVAKVRRDDLFACIAARYEAEFGPVEGGGYVNEATRAFVRRYVRAHGALPPEARRTWPWKLRGVGPRAPLGIFRAPSPESSARPAQLDLFAAAADAT
jgi:ribonuclease HII